jgi:hypothetical protein
MRRDALEDALGEARQDRHPRLVRGRESERLRSIEPPEPRASFGYVNDWVTVEGKFDRDAYLIIPFDPKRLGWIGITSLRIFRFDSKRKRFEMLAHSRVDPKAAVVSAPVSRGGAYGIIGLHGHPLVREAIRQFCQLRSRIGALPESGQKAFRDRVCDLILCAGDMKGFLESRRELEKLVGPLGKDAPDGMPPLISRPAFPGETICDRCHGAGEFVPEIPECVILEDPADRPCRLAEWENVGPKHISGVIRQVVIDPNAPQRLYAVSANGGIWRLEDKDDYPNTTWRPITDGETNLRFRMMAIAPSDSRVLYAATATKTRDFAAATVFSEIYVNRNRAASWGAPIHQAGMGVVHRLAVHANNPDVLFAATSEGLWVRSFDVWTRLFDGDCLDVALDPDDSSIIYLGVRGVGLFKSFTSGATWPAAPILALDPVATSDDPTTVAVESGTRQTIKIALGRRNSDNTLQTPLTRTVVVRFGNQINVHRSAGDDAAGWLQSVPSRIIPNPDPATVAARPNIDTALNDLQGGNIRRSDTFPRQSDEWCNCLAVDPFNPDHILVGSVGMQESFDITRPWIDRGSFAHEDNHSIVFDESETGRGLVYVSNDGGLFVSRDAGATWPSMSLADTTPSARGTNLAMGLITSELKRMGLRGNRCLTAIDHTGFILCEHLDEPDSRWQFLFEGPDNSARHVHENSFVFGCPASADRYYVFNNRDDDDPTNVRRRLAQFDFTRTNGLVDLPAFSFLTTGLPDDLPASAPAEGNFFPDDTVYDRTHPGPFAIRFSEDDDERLILYGTVNKPGAGFTIQSLRLATNGTAVTAGRQEGAHASPFSAIVFAPPGANRAFAITENGALLERDFSDPAGTFDVVSQFALGADDVLLRVLVPVRMPGLRLYALAQSTIRRYEDDRAPMQPVHEWPNPKDERLISLVAHPSREGTLFLGTTRGVYLSENEGVNWSPYSRGLPSVPVMSLVFDSGFLYAATYGRGLWRCRPCR